MEIDKIKEIVEKRELTPDLQRLVHGIEGLHRIVDAAKWVVQESEHKIHELDNLADELVLKHMNRKREGDNEYN